MTMNIKLTLVAGTALALLTALPAAAQSAQDFPTKPMTYIIPFNAGGESDVSARYQQSVWKDVTGQDVVVQYQPGAGGATAWSQLNQIEGYGDTIMGITDRTRVVEGTGGSISVEMGGGR